MPAATPARRRSTGVSRTTSGRTTAKKPKPKTTYDFDAEMAEEFGEIDPDEILVVKVGPLFGDSYHLMKEVNQFNMSGLGDIEEDTAIVQRFMISMVHPYEQSKFRTAMARAIDMRAERLLFLLRRMIEAVAEGKATTMSSASGGSSKTMAGRTLSPAASDAAV